jgi:hypothetical protein
MSNKEIALKELFDICCEHSPPLVAGVPTIAVRKLESFKCTLCGEEVSYDMYNNIYFYKHNANDSYIGNYFTLRLLLFLNRYAKLSFFGVKPDGKVNLCAAIKNGSLANTTNESPYFYSATSYFAEGIAYLAIEVFNYLVRNKQNPDSLWEEINGNIATARS